MVSNYPLPVKVGVSVVIPCFNEEDSIPDLVSRAKGMLSRIPGEVIFVDNGSSDSTRKVLKESVAGHSAMRILPLDQNRGYGAGVKAGLAHTRYNVVGWTHADLEVPLSAVEECYAATLDTGSTTDFLVKGRRFGRPLRKKVFTRLMSMVAFLLLRKWLPDSNAVPVVLHREFLWLVDDAPEEFDFDLYVFWRACVNGVTVLRVPYLLQQRLYGDSSWATNGFASLRLGLKLIRSMKDFSERSSP